MITINDRYEPKYFRLNRKFNKSTVFDFICITDSDISIPKITVCSNSMHSLEKLTTKYPNITIDVLKEFYGRSAVKMMERNHRHNVTALASTVNFTRFNGIGMRTFYKDTSPNYMMIYCKIALFDCSTFWKTVIKNFTHIEFIIMRRYSLRMAFA